MEYTPHALFGPGCHNINRVKLLTKASAVILGDKIILPLKNAPISELPKIGSVSLTKLTHDFINNKLSFCSKKI